MKKILFVVFTMALLHAKATVWTVTVSNFQFSPQTLNVVVGDQIHWVNSGGNHSTTSQSVPAGAASWNSGAPLTTFDYTVTKAGSYVYYCTVHGFATMNGNFTASNPVPVTVASFNIITLEKKPVITWATATELNVHHYSIRKSTNGTDFNEIGRVPATGTSSVERHYSFTDNAPGDLTYVYYNLAVVDNDGRTQLFPIKLYKNTYVIPKLIVSLSPNPITGSNALLLQFNADKSGIMQVTILDIQGKVVLNKELSAVEGLNKGHLHLGGLSPGLYTLRFDLGASHESYQVTKN